MALGSGRRLGNTSVSSLVRSANSLQSEINTYNDSMASYQYELSTKSDADLAAYQDYLAKRINNLQSTGSVTDANKALTLARTVTTATRSNVSANIQRENIDVMSGNGTLQDKYNVIVGQFQRATSIGDLSLAQQLESQAYSVSQSIQYQAQQAAQAGSALRSAAQSAGISDQTAIVGSLDDSLKQLNNDIKHLGVKDFNKTATAWVDQNRDVLKTLGAIIPDGAQPNYFNLVEGIQAAKYNSLVLKAQLQSATNPAQAANTLRDAQLLRMDGTKIDTLGGPLSINEIHQAAQDPAMFAYDNTTGNYRKTAQVGYQFIDGQLAPQYSGVLVGKNQNLADVNASGAVGGNNVQTMFFLNPNQTAELHGLGLNFSMNDKSKTTGDGVQVQLTENSPGWLKDILTKNGVTNVFTDPAGNLSFKGNSSDGNGMSAYTLVNVGGLSGIFEHFADGSSKLAGGNYGFDSGAAQLLVNMGQQKQQQIQLQTKAEQAAQAAIQVQQFQQQQVQLQQQQAQARSVVPQPVSAPTFNPQRTVSATSLQGGSPNTTSLLQPASANISKVQGVPLNSNPSGPRIKL